MDTNSHGQNTLFCVLSHNLETQIIQTQYYGMSLLSVYQPGYCTCKNDQSKYFKVLFWLLKWGYKKIWVTPT